MQMVAKSVQKFRIIMVIRSQHHYGTNHSTTEAVSAFFKATYNSWYH